MVTHLHEAVFKRNTYMLYATLVELEALHLNSVKRTSTQGRARARSALALQGVDPVDPCGFGFPGANYTMP